MARSSTLLGLCMLLGSIGGCGSDKASMGKGGAGGASGAGGTTGAGGASGTGGTTGAGGACPVDILPGYACQPATGCPVDPYDNGTSGSMAGTCDCVASQWRCTFPVCPTMHPFDLPPTFWCGADVVMPAGCACHVETNSQQGESYCVCSITTDAGSGG